MEHGSIGCDSPFWHGRELPTQRQFRLAKAPATAMILTFRTTGSIATYAPLSGDIPPDSAAQRFWRYHHLIRNLKTARQPAFDHLDPRRLLAAHVTASLAHGVLTVKGTAAADVIAVDVEAQKGGVVAIAGVGKTFPTARVKRIVVLGGPGDDVIAVQNQGRPNLPVRIQGGAGNDTINGTSDFPRLAPPTPVIAPIAPPMFSVVQTSVTATTLPPPAAVAITAPSDSPITFVVGSPVASTANPDATAQRIVALTNAQRVQNGLAPLSVNVQLTQAADIQSGNMARLEIMSHTLPGTATPDLASRAAAVGYRYSSLGENIAWNYADADAVVAGWMASSGHRANILNPNFTEIGVSVATSGNGQPYYTQEFGTPA